MRDLGELESRTGHRIVFRRYRMVECMLRRMGVLKPIA